MELWYQQHSYLTSPAAVQAVESTIDVAAAAGYTGVVLWDSSINVVNQPFWSSNLTYLEQVITYAKSKGMKIMPSVFPYGYSNDILNQNPNWAEAQRVTGTQFQVSADGAQLNLINSFPGLQNASFESGQTAWFSYGDPDVSVDTTVAHTGSNSARIAQGPGSNNARLFQQFSVVPWRQYHLRLWIKTQNLTFSSGFAVYVMDSSDWNAQRLNGYISMSGAANVNQDWTAYDFTINSQSSTSLSLLMGEWGGSVGTLWVDDVVFEETDLVYVVRRDGTPLKMYDPANSSTVFQEGTDFNSISDPEVAPGGFTDKYHTPPVVTLPSGTRLRPGQIVAIDSYAVVPIYGNQVGMCLTDAGLQQYLQANINSVVSLFGSGNPMMFGYDEMRHLNSCATCRAKNMTAGQLLAWSVGQSMSMLNNVSPGTPVYFWNDMFDPNMNAHNDYYYVEGDLTGSWLGLPANATIMNWNLGNLQTSLKFFAGLTPQQTNAFHQVISGFYDPADNNGSNAAVAELQQASGIPGVVGMMYTTWTDNYGQLTSFAAGATQGWPAYLASVGLTLTSTNGTITGTVSNSAGMRVTGAQVLLMLSGGTPVSVTTGSDGSFLISKLSPGNYSMTVTATGYAAAQSTITITAGVVNTLALTLIPSSFSPIRINAGGGAYTDSSGHAWTADTAFVNGATYAGSAPISNTPDPALYQTERYSEGVPLEYKFAVPNGSYNVTLKFAEIYFTSPGQRVFNIVINGATVLPNLDIYAAAGGSNIANDQTFVASVSSNVLDIQLVPVVQNPKVSAIQIVLASGAAATGSIAGTISSASGTPVPGATISWSGGSATAMADGSYVLSAVPSGTVNITVTASGYQNATQSVAVNANSTATQNFVLQPVAGTISGIITSGGTPVSGATVSCSCGSATTTANGGYALSNVPAGTVSITASAPGYQSAKQNVTVLANSMVTQNFALMPISGTISGKVTNSVGAAISGATVSYSGGSIITATDGSFTFSNVPAGTVTIAVSAANFAGSSQITTVSPGAITTANFILRPLTGSISGTVTAASGKAVAGATVRISGGVVLTSVTITTDAKGHYQSGVVPVGNYQITVVKGGFTSQTKATTVTANTVTAVDFNVTK
jgi:hypothetical protein